MSEPKLIIRSSTLEEILRDAGENVFLLLQLNACMADFRFRTKDGRRYCCFIDGPTIVKMLDLRGDGMTKRDRRRIKAIAGAILEVASSGQDREEWARPMIFHDEAALKQAWASLHWLHRVGLSDQQAETLFCGDEYDALATAPGKEYAN